MFSDSVIEEVISRKEVIDIPFEYRVTMMNVIYEVLYQQDLIKESGIDGIQ